MRGTIFKETELEGRVEKALSRIRGMDDEGLVRIAAYARKLELYAFIIRGACASELRKRADVRLAGGHGRRDEAGTGVQARLERLAGSVGIDVVTLRTDARIYETFFAGHPGGGAALARERSLSREFYVTALAAPDPRAAVEMAIATSHARTYTRQQFRADVRALKNPTQAGGPTRRLSKAICPRCASLTHAARRALSALCRVTGGDAESVISEALLALHERLLCSKPEKPDAARSGFVSSGRKDKRKKVAPVMDRTQYSFEYSEDV
jgi:hypothetical protein